MLKKIFISTLLFLVLFTQSMLPFSVAKANAQWYTPEFTDWYVKVYDTEASPETEIFGERYTAAQVTWVVYGLYSTIFNSILHAVGLDPVLLVCAFTGSFDRCGDMLDAINPFTNQETENLLL